MASDFYFSKEYKAKQSQLTGKNWSKGTFDFLRKIQKRACKRKGCSNYFEVKPSNPKVYCSKSCATIVNNKNRGKHSEQTKSKISNSKKGKILLSRRGKTKTEYKCGNPRCGKSFLREAWKKPKFCSNACSIETIGRKVTSHKASRGKAGVRIDISKNIYFYSRWEANIARLYNYKKVPWVYAPDTFDIGEQNYTPDFYLPEEDKYVEVKNFWGKYSKDRHEKFKKSYPDTKLEVILKKEYLELEAKYSTSIPGWEYKNSK
jgi:hypothetical protein